MFFAITSITFSVHFMTESPYRPGITPIFMGYNDMPRTFPLDPKQIEKQFEIDKAEFKALDHRSIVRGIAVDRWIIEINSKILKDPDVAKDQALSQFKSKMIEAAQKSLQDREQYIKDHPGIEDEIQAELARLRKN